MTQLRKSHGVSVTDRKTIKENPKMFTVADGVQVAATDLKGFKGNEVEVRALVSLTAKETPVRGVVGVFVDNEIHPLTARDFTIDAGKIATLDLKQQYKKELDKTHIQVRVSSFGEVDVIGSIDADELTLVPEVAKPIIGDIHPSLAPEVPEDIKKEFLGPTAPEGEAN